MAVATSSRPQHLAAGVARELGGELDDRGHLEASESLAAVGLDVVDRGRRGGSVGTITAFTTSPHRRSGTPTTATSRMPSRVAMARSTSTG